MTQPKRRWLKILGISAIVAVILLFVLFQYFTSSGFLTKAVSRVISNSTNAQASVDRIDLGGLSRIEIENLVIEGPAPENDRIAIGHVSADWSLWSIITGSPHIGAVVVKDIDANLTIQENGQPTIEVKTDPDAPQETPRPEPSGEGETPHLILDSLELSNIALRITDQSQGEDPLHASMRLEEMTLNRFDSEQGLESFGLRFLVEEIRQAEHTQIRGGLLTADAGVALDGQGGVLGNVTLNFSGLSGQWQGQAVDAVAVNLNADISTDDAGMITIEDGSLRLTDGETTLGQVALTGQVDSKSQVGELRVTLSDITAATFELVAGDVDFGDSALRGEVVLDLSPETLGVTSEFTLSQLSILAPEINPQRTPPLDLDWRAECSFNADAQTVTLSAFDLNGMMRDQPFVTSTLSAPMTIALGGTSMDVPDASLDIGVTIQDLNDLRALLPLDQVRGGAINANLSVAAREGGNSLSVEGSVNGQRLVLVPVSDPLPAIGLQVPLSVQVDMVSETLTLEELRATITRQGAQPSTVALAGEVSLDGSSAQVDIHLTDLDLALAGMVAGMDLSGWTLDGALEVPVEGNLVEIETAQLTFKQDGRETGAITLNGQVDIATITGEMNLTIEEARIGALAAEILGAPELAGLNIVGQQSIAFENMVETAQANGTITLNDAIRVDTPSGPKPLTLVITDDVVLGPGTLRVNNTGLTTQLQGLPPQRMMFNADMHLLGGQKSTFSLTGDTLDLDPILAVFAGEETAASSTPAPTPSGGSGGIPNSPLPSLPDPGLLDVEGTVQIAGITYSGVTFFEPSLAMRWRRPNAANPAREFVIRDMDIIIKTPSQAGNMRGEVALTQASDTAPLHQRTNITMTKTDIAGLLPAIAPDLADNVIGIFSMPEMTLESEGHDVAETLESLRGRIVLDLASGEIRNIPFLNTIARTTQLSRLTDVVFFEGGLTLVPNGDRLTIPANTPFYVKGYDTYLSVDGDVLYGGTQALEVDIAFSEESTVGGDMRSAGGGYVFPTHPADARYRLFPFPVTVSGPWAQPQVRMGRPRVNEMFPTLVDDIIQRELLNRQQVSGEAEQPPATPRDQLQDALENRGREAVRDLLRNL